LEAFNEEYNFAKSVFEGVNEELRLQQEAARNKQLEQQRNQVFNGAKADVELFDSVKKTLDDRIAQLQGVLAELQGAAERDEDAIAMRESQLEGQRAAMAATIEMQKRSTDNLRKIEEAEAAERAAATQRDAAAAVDQMRRDKKELTTKITEVTTQLETVNKTLADS
jgi:hypothetical protein